MCGAVQAEVDGTSNKPLQPTGPPILVSLVCRLDGAALRLSWGVRRQRQ
jgi:hypothetical protein